MDLDPVCPERYDPDPVNIRTDPQPCSYVKKYILSIILDLERIKVDLVRMASVVLLFAGVTGRHRRDLVDGTATFLPVLEIIIISIRQPGFDMKSQTN